MGLITSIKHAWNAFRSRDPTSGSFTPEGIGYGRDPTKIRLAIANERSFINSIYNRIAMDCASIDIRHVRVDQNGRYQEDMDSTLNQCLTVSPNIDQTPRAFIQDAILSMFDDGHVAIFIAKANLDPIVDGSYDIQELRIGKIREWYPDSIRIEAYNGDTGKFEWTILPKKITAIIQNPFYAVMNNPNSSLQRLIAKLNMLDAIDRQASSGKLDMIIQLPYTIKSQTKQQLAEDRRKKIEMQLVDSKYGIAYIDATERITQLNRPVENNLLAQIQDLKEEVYNQVGMAKGIFDGTATEDQIVAYQNRSNEPIISAIVDEMKRKFLTKTARSRGQTIMYFQDPFKLIPPSQMAEMADKFIRNEILSANEFRGILGFRPSEDPKANELRNPNIAASKQDTEEEIAPDYNTDEGVESDESAW